MDSSPGLYVAEKEKYRRFQEFFMVHINPYFKFFDHTLPDEHHDNYYFEREWRVVGNVEFAFSDIKKVLLPEEYETRFRNDFPDYKGPVILGR